MHDAAKPRVELFVSGHLVKVATTGNLFDHYGFYDISLGGSRTAACQSLKGSASDITISLNRFTDGGAGGVRIDNYKQAHSGNVIDSNVISYMGRVFEDASAITVWGTSGTKINSNVISYTPNAGIWLQVMNRYSASDYNEIIGNKIFDTMQRLRDGGGIYVGAPQGIIQSNEIRNVGTSRPADAPPFQDSYRLGVYLDGGVYFKVLSNITPSVLTKSYLNIVSGNTTDGSTPARIDSSDGVQNYFPTSLDGTPISTKPTWW